jgi:hypothetical protein
MGPALQYSLEKLLNSSRKMLGSAGHDQTQYNQSAHFRNYCALYIVLTRTLFLTEQKVETHKHKLNMKLDLQSLFGLHVYSCIHWLRPRNPTPPPPAFGLIYEGAIGQPR